jgi:hypothetical protein
MLLLFLLFLLDGLGLRWLLNLRRVVLRDNDIGRCGLIVDSLFFIRAIMLRLHVVLIVIVLLNLGTLPLGLHLRSYHGRVSCLQIGGVIDRRR